VPRQRNRRLIPTPGGEVHVVSVSISVYGHLAWGSVGAGDYKAHEQVS
jgi:hypothetical protein